MIDVERSVRAEQIRLLFKSPISIMGSALAATVSLTMLWGSVPSSLLLAWSSAILLWLGIRGMMWLRFRREESDDVLVARWARPAIIMMSGSGVLWGAFGAGFYLPDDPELSAFVILIVASMVLGGTFAYAAYLPAFNAFVMTTIAPLAVSSCLHGTATSVIFGATTVVNLTLMLSMGRSMNRSIVGMIRLKFANADLVGNLRHAKDAAEVASRVKSEFLATMSHELRTPLNAVLGFSEMIRDARSGPLDAKYRSYAADIHSSGEHLLALISDILDISKIEAGRLELHEERITIEALAARCLRLVAPRAE
ncbi:MAG TPA: histidine kinase dimerization/phospho-acceptor domain-containing protein, partial [Stellaceae bacterium]|nr:histidine kinase dimerization/phospho-acceptor domain-containing protein [Stellaceae bacterium]